MKLVFIITAILAHQIVFTLNNDINREENPKKETKSLQDKNKHNKKLERYL
jgi:hypothetical protein